MKQVTQTNVENSKKYVEKQIEELYASTDLLNADSCKRTNNYYEWLNLKTKYVINEPTYVCDKQEKLVRGAVVWVEFGFNVGNEFGGRHPAIILRRTGSSIFVVPLSSKSPHEKKDYHVKVDKVYGFKNMVRWANVLKLRDVSIQRVDTSASIGNVKGTVLDSINEALKTCHIF